MTNASLDAELKTVVLSNIKYENGVYKLEGPYCKIEDIEKPSGHNLNPVITTSGGVTGFNYNRSQTEFEAIMCYYHIDAAGKRVAQLGYNVSGLNALRADPHGMNGADNARYDSYGNYLTFGDGGVDAAEDADIIWHEYAHAIQDNLGAGNMLWDVGETSAVQEGSSDYWALSYKRSLSSYNWWLFANWDGHNEFWDGRRGDLNWVYPEDYLFAHEGGQIWNSALMKIWGDLGKNITDQLFLETHLIWGLSPGMRDAAAAFMQADVNLYNGIHLCNIMTRFKEHGLVLSAPTTISQSTTWNNPIYANNTITIPNSVILTIKSQVICEENTSFIVQPGGKLVINGGTLTAACSDKLWHGIVVLGNPNQQQLSQYQGTVTLSNNAVIEHALCGISAAPTSYGNAGGGIIIADSAIFRNNVRAIEYSPYENKNASGAVIDNIGKFTNCTFTVNNTDRFDVNGKTYWRHVNMWGVRGVTFEGCAFKNDIDVLIGRLPAPYNYGIYTMDAGFKVKNYCKSGGSTGVDCPCLLTHTTPSGFYRLTEGIRSENTGQPYYIHIDQSKFYDLGTGASMNVQTNYRLTRCELSNSGTGLYSSNSSGYKIEANDFSASATFTSAIGIIMNNSGIAENKIYKNDFNNLNKGISVQLINNSPFQITQGLQFLSNTFSNNNYDIYISSGATVRSNQGNSSSGADNKFMGTSTSSIFSQGSQPQAITYYHSPGGNKAPINPTSNVTVIGNARPGPTSSTLCNVTYRMEMFSDSLEQYKSMQQQYDDLLAHLKDNPDLLQELLLLSDAMRELSDHAISRILGDSILYLENLKPWYEVVRTPVAKYSLAEVHFYERKYDQAEMVLNEIPDMFEYSESEMTEHNNYMRFYNFKKQLQLADRNWTQLDETEITYLQTIAEATNGRSASMAQGVLCFFFDICYEDKIEEGEEGGEVIPPTKNMATETQPSDTQNQDLTYELSLYPNPTSSEMTVVLNNPAVKIVAMELYDLFGKKVHQQTVNQSYGTLKMDELAQGVYILKVRLNQGDVVVRKVVKQ